MYSYRSSAELQNKIRANSEKHNYIFAVYQDDRIIL